MNKVRKHKWEERNKLFFSSDWHNFHNPQKWDVPIWKQRDYSSPEESCKDVIEKINSKVGEEDYLYYGGDGFLNAKDEDVLWWFDQIKCQNILYVWGNHEAGPFRLYRQEVERQYGFKNVEIYPLTMRNVTFLGNYQEILVGRQKIVLSHFPFHVWNNMERFSWNLHGHCHNNNKTRNPEYPNDKTIDLGWDYKKDVWSFSEIKDVMETKNLVIYDHHE